MDIDKVLERIFGTVVICEDKKYLMRMTKDKDGLYNVENYVLDGYAKKKSGYSRKDMTEHYNKLLHLSKAKLGVPDKGDE